MNQPDNFEFLQKYQRLQDGIMYDELFDLSFATIGYSKTDSSTFWNVALVNQLISDEQISDVEAKLKELNRKPTFYFQHIPELEKLSKKLTEKGYKKDYEDSFQFWQNGNVLSDKFGSIIKVNSPEQLKVFLQTFDACYQNNDPQNPYGELGDYLKATENVWRKHHKSNRLEYFIVYKKEVPVAVSTLTNFDGIGYISNVGSLKSVRGEGFGKAATLFCVDKSIKNGNSEHCLATEEGHYPNDFYKRIGFATRFSAVGYSK